MIQANVWYLLQNIEILFISLSKSYHLNHMQFFSLEIAENYKKKKTGKDKEKKSAMKVYIHTFIHLPF